MPEPIDVVEALLFASDTPLETERIREVLDLESPRRGARAGGASCARATTPRARALQIVEVGGGFRLVTRPELAPWLVQLARARTRVRLSRPALETLAIIALQAAGVAAGGRRGARRELRRGARQPARAPARPHRRPQGRRRAARSSTRRRASSSSPSGCATSPICRRWTASWSSPSSPRPRRARRGRARPGAGAAADPAQQDPGPGGADAPAAGLSACSRRAASPSTAPCAVEPGAQADPERDVITRRRPARCRRPSAAHLPAPPQAARLRDHRARSAGPPGGRSTCSRATARARVSGGPPRLRRRGRCCSSPTTVRSPTGCSTRATRSRASTRREVRGARARRPTCRAGAAASTLRRRPRGAQRVARAGARTDHDVGSALTFAEGRKHEVQALLRGARPPRAPAPPRRLRPAPPRRPAPGGQPRR